MPEASTRPVRSDPYKNYNFRISMDGRHVAGVSKVVGLQRPVEPVKLWGSDESTVLKLPGRIGYRALLLERGVTQDAEFGHWASNVWSHQSNDSLKTALPGNRKDLLIEIYNEAGQKVLAHRVYRAWISDFQARPSPDPEANAVLIQSIRLEHEGFECCFVGAKRLSG